MNKNLKKDTIRGLSWTFTELIFNQGFIFFVGILIARKLGPEEFGVYGILVAIITILNSICEGGFGLSVQRLQTVTDQQLNTVFTINTITAVLLFLIVFLSANALEYYLEVPDLHKYLQVAGISVLFFGASIIQQALLLNRLEFDKISKLAIYSAFGAGVITLIHLYIYGSIWTLLVLLVSKPVINTILLWKHSDWRPKFQIDKASFKYSFNFGYRVLLANIINTIYRNGYYILIGKYHSITSLGFYTRAEQFQSPVSRNLTAAVRKVSFPVLSKLQDDRLKLKSAFGKYIQLSTIVCAMSMCFMAGAAEEIILITIGEKWTQSIYYLQLLSVLGILYPLQILHLILLQLLDHTEISLKLEIIKKSLLIPFVILLVPFGIPILLFGLILFSVIELVINSSYTKRFIGYSWKDQLNDIYPALTIGGLTFLICYAISGTELHILFRFSLQLITGVLLSVTLMEWLSLSEYLKLKQQIVKVIKIYI